MSGWRGERTSVSLAASVMLLVTLGCGGSMSPGGAAAPPTTSAAAGTQPAATATASTAAPRFVGAETGPATVSAARPRVVVDQKTHDFGVIDVGSSGKHAFVVRNAGDADLVLEFRSATCKCTLAKIETERVPPGQSTRIELEWEAEVPSERFRHGAFIGTNDPDKPEIELVIEGFVRAFVALEPSWLRMPDLRPGETRVLRALMYSQAWEGLRVTRIESSLPQVKVRAVPAGPQDVHDEYARSAFILEITAEPGLPRGTFHSDLAIHFEVPGVDVSRHTPLRATLGGEVIGFFELVGPGVEGRFVHLGTARQGVGLEKTVSLLARGEQREFEVRRVKVEPPVVEVAIRRDPKVQGPTARYLVELRVPPDAPVGSHGVLAPVQVEVETNHPGQSLSFGIDVAIAP